MRPLPDSPNLDHLRQQAKDVLAQLRSRRSDATLAEAQTLVAERYGFRAWTDLKAEVECRGATTKAAGDGTAEAIAASFDVGQPQGALTALERQWAGQAWVLTTDGGRWLARNLFDWIDHSAVEREVTLATAAADAGIQTLRPVRSVNGLVIEDIGGSRWRLYALPSTGPEPSLPANPRHAEAAGRIVGTVHRLALPAPEPIGPWLTCVRTEEQWWHLHRAAAERDIVWAGRLAALIPSLVDVSGIVEPADGPAAATTLLSGRHYAPGAFRVTAADDLAVMTWEHAGAIPPRWDLGGALSLWSGGVPGEVNAAAVRALVAGYAEVTPLPCRLDLGIFSSILCAETSWLISRIRIALTETDREQRELADKAVPWLLADPPSRSHFERILDAVS